MCSFSFFIFISYDSLDVRASYSFTEQELILEFHRVGFQDFEIDSLDLVYDFANYKLNENELVCTKDLFHYEVSLSKVPRHVLYKQFTCEVYYRLNKLPGKFCIKLHFDVPYFRCATDIKLEKSKIFAVPKEIETLFEGDKEKDNPKLLSFIQ